MSREELLKADLLSEIVLVGSSVAILLSLVIVVAAAAFAGAGLQ
jgi:hypothetical protein